MFQKEELDRLQKQKELLVLQSEANRQRLVDDCQRLSSPEFWIEEGQGMVRRHPGMAAGLAAAAGMLIVRRLRSSGGISGAIGIAGAASLMAALGHALGDNKMGFDPPRLVPWSAAMAVGTLVLCGVLAGIYPARRAAMLEPVEALRKE